MGEVLYWPWRFILLGYFVGIRKCLKAISAAMSGELPTSDYQKDGLTVWFHQKQ